MRFIDLDSCKVEFDKLICDIDKAKFKQDVEITGRGTLVTEDKKEFEVEAPPYTAQDIGISVPIGPLPGAPSISATVGVGFPYTIFPIPTRLVDRMGQSWSPMPIQAGPEDKWQGLPDVRLLTPEEFVKEIKDVIMHAA